MSKDNIELTEEALRNLYTAENKTAEELARHFKVGVATIRRHLKKYNIVKPETQRREAISKTKQAKSLEELTIYKQHISENRKGKGLGAVPWNKNKKGLQIAWNKGFKIAEEAKQHLRDVYAALPEEEKQRRKDAVGRAHSGKTPWNRGLHYTIDPETVKAAKEKEIATKKLRNTFATSKVEEDFYLHLCSYFLPSDIIRQYFNKETYPFNCDFYIKPLDLFIELNINWTHGFKPYDPTDDFCQEQLAQWRKKAETSDYYKNAIYTWTDLDVRKRQIADKNKLLYIQLYSNGDIANFFKLLEE